MHGPQSYSHNWHVSTQCLSHSPSPTHTRAHLRSTFYLFIFYLSHTHEHTHTCLLVTKKKGKVSTGITEYLSNYQDHL